MLGNDVCFWRPMGHHIVVGTVALGCFTCGLIEPLQLMCQDNTILGRITRSADTTALEITRPALLSNLLYPCIVSATLFLSGRHID